ncbi:MAG: DEAD/DEAH box helicase [archaeon]
MDKFKKLGISEDILKVIENEKFTEPTEIQEKAIPIVLEKKDVIAGSATGSGKTLVFGVPLTNFIEKYNGICGLVLVPTRELAEQVSKELKKFSKHKGLRIAAIYGGMSINPQISLLKNSEIVVGTPGRILDHLERRTLNLSKVKILVLDEADRMLDMGFIKDVEKIIKFCPAQRQTMLFSATISQEISRLSRNYMNNPVSVSAENQVDPSKLKQVYYDVSRNLKFSLLVHLLQSEKKGLVMVFCNTRITTDFVAKNLKHQKIESIAIHGGVSQYQRNQIIEHFNSKDVFVLVCTDVAARGLDIKKVSHVYNYDISKDSKEYVHRIGRTARAGKEGKVINLLDENNYPYFRAILKDYDFIIEEEKTPFIEKINLDIEPRDTSQRGFRRGRDNFVRGSSHRPSQYSRSSGYVGADNNSNRSSRDSRSFRSNNRSNSRESRDNDNEGFKSTIVKVHNNSEDLSFLNDLNKKNRRRN